MGEMDDILKDYIFFGMDDDGLTDNNTEVMEYLFGDDTISPPVDQAGWKQKPNDVKRTSTNIAPPDGSLICDSEGSSRLKELLFKYFPGTRCHERTGEVEALEFIERNKATIIGFSDAFGIPPALLATVLYTEMTWSRLGYGTANALSYIKARYFGGRGSLGPGQVQTSHLTEWNPSISGEEAADLLYFNNETAIAASARLLGELFYTIKESGKKYSDKRELWANIAESYNNGAKGNPCYREAFLYSLDIVEDIFPPERK